MTELRTASAPAAAPVAEAEAAGEGQETTEEGRYIPYSGGSMGWFENSGVLKSELGNNYLFYTAMASDRVRSKQFQRWGERFNRRGGRQRFRAMTGISLGSGRGGARGTTRDISRHGVRVQFLSEVTLKKGDETPLRIHQDEQSDAVAVEVSARVVWSERIGRIRPVWNLGLTFENVTPEQEELLKAFLHD
jgi:PilZ domain